MDSGENYTIKDIKLAEQGMRNIEWAELQMGSLMKVRERVAKQKPFKGVRIGMALHITKETAVLVRTLTAGGATVAIASCNPLSTQDEAAAALAKEGVHVFGWKGESKEEYYDNIEKVIRLSPQVTIDDGCDLVTQIHTKHRHLIQDLICGCEETTTGVLRLRAMEREGALKYPMIAVNESDTKHLMDNYHGTGQSTLDGLLRASNILFASRTVVIAGYGSCGKGVALRARGMGANVIVTEVKPFRALQAHMDGFRVMPMNEAAPLGDIFISVTGNKHVIDTAHIKRMRTGAILANAGHFDNEINMEDLEKQAKSKRRIRPYFDEYLIAGRRIFVAGEGRLVNLAAAEGHPSTVMAMSFCNQAMAVEYGLANRGKLEPKVYTLPPQVDEEIARLQLEASGISIDTLTKEQLAYLQDWREGT